MRIPIREQLAALVLLTTLTGLAVVSIATWITNYDRVVSLRTQHLGLTASLKASQLSSNLDLMERSVRSLATRMRLQTALQAYNVGNNSAAQFETFGTDLQSALAAGEQEVLTLQAMVFPNSGSGSGLQTSLLNTTGSGVNVELPYDNANGLSVYLGDLDGGYPPNLYPNLTFTPLTGSDTNTAHFDGEKLVANSSILLGPWQTNETFALVSITLPVVNNTSATDILGWMTVVLDARLISSVLNSPVGLQDTGTMLLITPSTLDNRFHRPFLNDRLPITYNTPLLEQMPVQFAFPPDEPYKNKRHAERAYGKPNSPFNMTKYPILLQAITQDQLSINNAGGEISTSSEENYKVSVGYAIPESTLCTWALVLEQAQSEVWVAINELRRVILACILGTVGGMILLVVPIAHYSARPIRRLRDATAKSLRVVTPTTTEKDATGSDPEQSPQTSETNSGRKWPLAFVASLGRSRKTTRKAPVDPESLKTAYPIPQTVKTRKHLIQDELSDLTQYFNEMSDELVLHYGKLEERVRLRTAELEASKIAAEAANESKTLFIANISHELKTPLNGILGMCAVCMQEDDPARIKRSLEIIYKSGDLLHNLLTDLLTFSKNEVGQQLSLEEREFYVRDIGTQIKAIFENQAKEGRVNFTISYEGPRDALGAAEGTPDGAFGPLGTARVKDMCLWGDYHRILQVVINLVSNSLKFTPPEGSVGLKIRCCEQEGAEEISQSRRSSENPSTKSGKRPRFRILSRSSSDPEKTLSDDSKLSLDMRKQPSQASVVSDMSGVLMPNNTRILRFEFEVEDTGPGIAEHLQRKIFEPFVQGDLRLTKKFGGTGLGLSICQQLAKLMNGSVELKSEEGVGSKFTFRLPLKHLGTQLDSGATSTADLTQQMSRQSSLVGSQSQVAMQPSEIVHSSPNKTTGFEGDSKPRLVGLSQPYFSSAKAPMGSPGSEPGKKESKLKVLVAEDNKVNQEVVLRMLRLEEVFDVHLAKDGQEALDKVRESMEAQAPYDLVIMDIQMPILDGRQSTRLIREIGFSSPIVALTAFTDEINQKECLDSGMDYFLAKPIRRPALKHVLKTYCGPIQEEGDEGDSRSQISPLSPLDRDAPITTPKTVL